MKGLTEILSNPKLFSAAVLGLPLRHYQFRPVAAVAASCMAGKGNEYLWVFPRQSGKDEAVAQLEVMLMNLFQLEESNIVHCYPGELQIQVGVSRLQNRLDNLLNRANWGVGAKPTRRILGKCTVTFLSGHPMAKSEGQTAHPLLIINEAQDQDELIVNRRFTPFRAANNATALYVGTVRTEEDLLWQTYNRLRKLEREDRHKRVYLVEPEQVIKENEAYGKFLKAQIKRHGRQHPVIKTEYFNEPVKGKALLFPRRRQVLMTGGHQQEDNPDNNKIYVGLVDVGGIDESATGEFGELENPERDYTCATIVEVCRSQRTDPLYLVRDAIVAQGAKHFDGKNPLFNQLLGYLRLWNVKAVVCDATGVGAGISDALAREMTCQVIPFAFHKNHNKARLGNEFLSLVETNRFRYFKGNEIEGSAAWWFFEQVKACGYELKPGAALDTGLKWGVSDRAKVLVDGRYELLHDDRLLSAALVCEIERRYQNGEFFISTGESAVIHREEREEPEKKWQ